MTNELEKAEEKKRKHFEYKGTVYELDIRMFKKCL